MKKLIATACAAIASAAALASTVESSNTFGVLKVATANATTNAVQYFISVPWKTVGGNAETINPQDLVLPSNLNEGDRLYVYTGTGTGFGAWAVDDDGGVKTWEAQAVTDGTTGETIVPAGTEGAVSRGAGIIIETNAKAIYLTGQYSEDNTAITIAGSSDGTTPGYTLIGAKLAKSYALNSQTWTGATAGDVILLNGGKTTTYNGSSWSKIGGIKGEAPVLTAGTGAWYIRYGTGAASVTFTTPVE